MAYGSMLADVLQSSTAGTPPQFNDGNSVQIGTLCRAWVNFNGSTLAIRGAFNVSSITRVGTGNYQANFTTSLPDSNYSTQICSDASVSNNAFNRTQSTNTTTYALATHYESGGTLTDTGVMVIAVFR